MLLQTTSRCLYISTPRSDKENNKKFSEQDILSVSLPGPFHCRQDCGMLVGHIRARLCKSVVCIEGGCNAQTLTRSQRKDEQAHLAVLYVVSLASFGLVKAVRSQLRVLPVRKASQPLVLNYGQTLSEVGAQTWLHWLVHGNIVVAVWSVMRTRPNCISVSRHGRIRRGREGIDHHFSRDRFAAHLEVVQVTLTCPQEEPGRDRRKRKVQLRN